MEVTRKLALLGGLTAQAFMRRHWQKRPLLVRGALPGAEALLSRAELFALAARDDVESRLVCHDEPSGGKRRGPRQRPPAVGAWTLRHGPFARRALPPLARREWSLLVQGVDLHHEAAHRLLQSFRFIPEARLDDLMVSYASDGGGVGPHFDSYDVFLLQVRGRRRWRISQQADLGRVEGVPLKILARFKPEQEYLLEPGDMLYLPPGCAHDGVAVGDDCMTCSIGFRAPSRAGIARDLLQRIAETADESLGTKLYRDPSQPAVERPAQMPSALQAFGRDALQALLRNPRGLHCALGEILTEPKAHVWFEPVRADTQAAWPCAVALDRRSRMLYDEDHVFMNGESHRAAGRDATLMRCLADRRGLSHAQVAGASAAARDLLRAWCEDGWLHPVDQARASA